MKDVKEEAMSFLGNCPDDKRFWCSNSSVFASLQDLENGLKTMDKNTFDYHVNKDKNDFSAWVYDVIGDVKLAESLRGMKSAKEMRNTLKNRIAFLQKTIKYSSI
jgi:hypothetical protein